MTARRTVLALLAAGLTLWLAPASASADHTQESVFQDDTYLVNSPTTTVAKTLGLLQALGVQRIRVNVEWYELAPDALSTTMPARFNGGDPAQYPAANWAPYDRLVKLAQTAGIGVQFNLTAPGPLWAMGKHPPTSRAANHWRPSAKQFLLFTYALGTRYSGSYASLPRVDNWSIWNEPDQPGWLAPQASKVKGKWVAQAPSMYRGLVRAAFNALYLTGHAPTTDTVLIGELAPEGYETPGDYTAMTPLPFIRDLYCVNGRYRPLTGTAAKALGCPKDAAARKQFVTDNPGLFTPTGFSHHPYYFLHPPSFSASDPNFVPLANLGRLERTLDRSMRAWQVKRKLPIYFTEYGYQTRPPDPYQIVTPAMQADYLNQADYLAWRSRRVRSVAQFLLFDYPPDPRFTPNDFGYWDTFQTGLLFANGTPKPAFYAYKLPIWIPTAKFRRHARVFIWGQLRAAPHDVPQQAVIQWRPRRGSYRNLATVTTNNPDGFVTARVRLPGTGVVKLAWTDSTGATLHSRAVDVTQR